MKMGLRWFGEGYDTVSLEKIRQVPGVRGVITTLYGAMPGENWDKDQVLALQRSVEDAGLEVLGIESVNVHDAIKAGLSSRDQYIENYIQTIRTLGECGIHLICYNFMPVFDWTRTQLAKPRKDGSTVLAYDQREIDKMDPEKLFASMEAGSQGHLLPGWEPERLAHIQELFQVYKSVDEEAPVGQLEVFPGRHFAHLRKYEVKMAIHPDDPGLERLWPAPHHHQRGRPCAAWWICPPPPATASRCAPALWHQPPRDLPGSSTCWRAASSSPTCGTWSTPPPAG